LLQLVTTGGIVVDDALCYRDAELLVLYQRQHTCALLKRRACYYDDILKNI